MTVMFPKSEIIKLLRPRHWIKNLFLFAPPFFAGSIFNPEVLKMAIPAFISFSSAASAVYIFNDINDKELDKNHPVKNKRPLASGKLSVNTSLSISLILFAISIFISLRINSSFTYFICAYLGLNILYTLSLKFLPIFDIFSIAGGFIIRVMAGGEAFQTEVSNWLFLSVLFISILLASGKRISEINNLKDSASIQGNVPIKYPDGFLESIVWLTGGASLISYSLYTIEKGEDLFYTVLLSAFGLIRYLYLVKMGKGEPTEAIFGDRVLSVTIVLWIVAIWFLRYT